MGVFFQEYIWPGLGLFAESYLLFSVGTLKPIWEILYPDCFDYETCSRSLIHSLTYNVVLGIILGMITIGIASNKIGRRAGSITTASFMMGGALGLALGTLFLNHKPELLFQTMSWCLFVFGIGVGGEYPLSASSASEKAMTEMKERFERAKSMEHEGTEELTAETDVHATNRGKKVILVFTMQGVGIFFNTLSVTLLLLVFGQLKGNVKYDGYYVEDDDAAAEAYNKSYLILIWQTIYIIGALFLVYILTSRVKHLEESKMWQEDRDKREQIETKRKKIGEFLSPSEDSSTRGSPRAFGRDSSVESPTRLLLNNYGYRLFGTSMSWLLWDIAFYGHKLFQSAFLLELTGDNATLFELSGGEPSLGTFFPILTYCESLEVEY